MIFLYEKEECCSFFYFSINFEGLRDLFFPFLLSNLKEFSMLFFGIKEIRVCVY